MWLGCGLIEGYADNEDLIGEWFERTGKRNEVCSMLSCASSGVREEKENG